MGSISGSQSIPHLHGNQTVINQYLLRQEIRPNRRLVTCTELFIDLSKH
jgi:hypothetical protein